MSEQLIHPTEHKAESHHAQPEHTQHKEAKTHHAESEHKVHHQNVERLHEHAKAEALSRHDVSVEEKRHDTHSAIGTQRKLKAESYKRTLHKIRSQLSPAEQTLSKFIHRPAIESVSNVAASSVARPSGLLGAGIFSFVGSAIVLFYSRYYGFSYNFFVFLGLFAVGFLFGIGIEILLRLVTGKKN